MQACELLHHWHCLPVDISGTVVGESLDCLLLSGTVVGENPDHVCWAIRPTFQQPFIHNVSFNISSNDLKRDKGLSKTERGVFSSFFNSCKKCIVSSRFSEIFPPPPPDVFKWDSPNDSIKMISVLKCVLSAM